MSKSLLIIEGALLSLVFELLGESSFKKFHSSCRIDSNKIYVSTVVYCELCIIVLFLLCNEWNGILNKNEMK